MKINSKLLLLTFSIITIVSISTTFIYHTLAHQLLRNQQSKALVNSGNDFIFAFQEFVEDIDSEYQKKILGSGEKNINSNLDFIFEINNDSTILIQTMYIRDESSIYKRVSSLNEFLKINTSLIIRKHNNVYYGRQITGVILNELSEKIRSEIALVEGNVVSKFTNDKEKHYYLPYLSRISRELKVKNNFEIINETLNDIDLSATHYSPNVSVTLNKELDFIIYSSSNEAEEFRSTMRVITLVIVTSGILLAVIFLFLFTTKFRKQLDYINEGVEKIAKGEIKERVKIITKDEVGNLGNAFNNMLDEIEKRDKAEKEYLEFVSIINQNPSLQEVGDATLHKIISSTKVDVGAFYLYESGKLKAFSTIGLPLKVDSIIDEAGFYKKAIDKGDLIEINFKENHPVVKTGITELKISWLYILPIYYNSKIISILELASVNNPNMNVREYLNKIKDRLAIGLANGKSLSELKDTVLELKKLNKAYEEQNLQISSKNNELIQLHEKLKKGSEQLEIQTKKAVQSEKLKSQFLANMSHELRTPQNAILGLTELILKDKSTSTETKEKLNVVLRNGKKLLTLIENILEYSKVESGNSEIKYSTVLLSEFLKEVEAFVQPFFIDGNLTFEVCIDENCDYELNTDIKKVEQILYNLIGNAVKFTKAGFVKLEVNVRNNNLIFNVIDSGPGISEEDQKIIFNEFTQVDAELNRKFSGTGLGLAVCKRYIELLNGVISVESKINFGSKFIVELPNHISKKLHPTIENSKLRNENKNLRGIIISNGTNSTNLIEDYLKSYNIEVLLYKPYTDLFSSIITSLPDFIIIDILNTNNMGWDLLYKIKSNKQLCNIPVIVVNMDEEANCGLGFNIYQYYSNELKRENIYNSIEKIEEYQGIKFRKLLFVCNKNKYEEIEEEVLFDEVKSYHHKGDNTIVEFVKMKEPDLIFIDLFDVTINSFDILEQLNSEFYSKDIPIIAFIKNLQTDKVSKINNNLLESTLVYQHHPLDVLKVIKDRIELIDSSVFSKDSNIIEIDKEPKNNFVPTPNNFDKVKIMIVDDNADARFTIGEIVKSLGYETIFAEDGYECLDLLEQEIPDLILLDIMMPKMDGFKTIKEIRNVDRFKDINVYALTAYAMLSDKEIIEKNGFNGLFTKPINSLQLERKLNQIFKSIA